MPKINPRARRALTEERRKQILDAAAHVFAKKGFERATIANIAQAAGVAEGSIYNYFRNKGDLLVSIPRQAIQPTIESMSLRMAAMTGNPLPPEQMLTALVQNMIAAIQQNAHVFRILLSALPTMNKSTREKYLNQVILYVITMLGTYFKEQIDSGVFRPGLDASTLARAFVGMFFPFVMIRELLQIETEADGTYDQIIAEIVPLFLRGVMTPGQSASSKNVKRTQRIPIQ